MAPRKRTCSTFWFEVVAVITYKLYVINILCYVMPQLQTRTLRSFSSFQQFSTIAGQRSLEDEPDALPAQSRPKIQKGKIHGTIHGTMRNP